MYRGLKPFTIWYSIENKHSFDFNRTLLLNSSNEICKNWQKELDNLPHIVCNGVWDFYEKIGYDRKTKKYLK